MKDIQLEQNLFVAGEGSLWFAWVKPYVLKGEDFWQVVSKDGMSWSMRRLLKMRDEAARVFSWSLSLSVSKIWCEIRRAGTKVQWYPLNIPKHAIITWMSILDRLRNKDKLIQLGIIDDGQCKLCCALLETRSHLFSECASSKSIWASILHRRRIHRLTSFRLPFVLNAMHLAFFFFKLSHTIILL